MDSVVLGRWTLSSDKFWLAYRQPDGAVLVNLRTFERKPLATTDLIRAMALSGDGQWLATAHDDRIVHLWETRGTMDSPFKTLTINHAELTQTHDGLGYPEIDVLRFNHEGDILAAGGSVQRASALDSFTQEVNFVQFWDLNANNTINYQQHSGNGVIYGFDFTDDGEHLITAVSPTLASRDLYTQEGILRIWDAQTGTEQASARIGRLIDWDDSRANIASANHLTHNTESIAVQLINLQTLDIITELESGFRRDASAITISPDGHALAVELRQQHGENPIPPETWIWSDSFGWHQLRGSPPFVFSADGQYVITGNGPQTNIGGSRYQPQDTVLRVWQVATGQLHSQRPTGLDNTIELQLSQDGNKLLSFHVGDIVEIWTLRSGSVEQ